MSQLKDIAFWDWDYLSGLPTGEHDWIDYKDSRFFETIDNKSLSEVSEYLSAFANYDGGYLVVGMSKQLDGSHCPDAGVILRHPKYKDLKEWLEDKLPGLVDPPLPKLAVQAIPNPLDGTKGVIVIHVPESEFAPHQGHKERFYSRRGSKNRALTTREIFDIRGRKKHPDLTAEIAIFLREHRLDKKSRLNLYIKNNGAILCQHYGGRLLVPVRFKNWHLSFSDNGAYIEDESPEECAWSISVSSGMAPSFPDSKRIHAIDFIGLYGARSLMEGKSSDVIKLTLFADEAQKKEFIWKADDVVKADQ